MKNLFDGRRGHLYNGISGRSKAFGNNLDIFCTAAVETTELNIT